MSDNEDNNWNVNWDCQPISVQYPGSPLVSYIAGTPILTTSGSVWGSSVSAEAKADPTLFDELQAKMLGKNDEPKLENKNIVSIRSMLALIHNTFSSNYHALNCFFSINRLCFHSLSSLPVIKLNLVKDSSSTIVFSSDWKGEKRAFTGWDLNENETQENFKRAKQFSARSVFVINDVTRINIYKWGFEILSKSGMRLVAILSFALDDKPEQTMGHIDWKYPLKQEIYQDRDMLNKIASWDINDNKSQDTI